MQELRGPMFTDCHTFPELKRHVFADGPEKVVEMTEDVETEVFAPPVHIVLVTKMDLPRGETG